MAGGNNVKPHTVGSGGPIKFKFVEGFHGYGIIINGINPKSHITYNKLIYMGWKEVCQHPIGSYMDNDTFEFRGMVRTSPSGYSIVNSVKCPGLMYTIDYHIEKCKSWRKVINIPLPLPPPTQSKIEGWLVKSEAIGRLYCLGLSKVINQIELISTAKVNAEYFIPDSNMSRMFELVQMVSSTFPNFRDSSYIVKHTL
jgi:hypothetical protein